MGEAMAAFAKNPNDDAAADVLSHPRPRSVAIRTTCIPTLLRGGHADNALPQSATVTVNCRIFPGVAVDSDVGKKLQRWPGLAFDVKVLGEPIASTLRRCAPMSWRPRPVTVHACIRACRSCRPRKRAPRTGSTSAPPAFRPTASLAPSSRTATTSITDLNERLPVKSFYEDLQYWYLLAKALSAPKA